MKPAPFAYLRPTTVDEALEMLAGGHAKVLAGGQSLVPIMSMRLASPETIVDINHLAGLDTIERGQQAARVGCLVRHAAIERDWAPGVGWSTPTLVRQALAHVAHPTIRNRGTTVGSLAHADPAAELPAVLCLLGGSVEARSAARGTRTIAADDFFVGPLESALAADELAVAATFPHPPASSGTAWLEVSRRNGDYAIVGVGAVVTLDEHARFVGAKLGFIGVGPNPVVVDITAALDARTAGPFSSYAVRSTLGDVEDLVASAVDPEADVHASADYRAHLARQLATRAVVEAVRDATDYSTWDPSDGRENEDDIGDDHDA